MHLRVAALLCLLSAPTVVAQDPARGGASEIYGSSAPAVFLIEVRDASGERVGIGTAFLIEGNRLITNAHVVTGGTPYLKTGAVALPLAIERMDARNDLAVLSVGNALEARPLKLAPGNAPIGSTVFALGNPHGLERTISQGLISGRREVEGRDLLQITASISPGSSGGPVIDTAGAVVGVTVGYFRDGQNLNFAIPSAVVRQLLASAPSNAYSTAYQRAVTIIDRGSPPYTDTEAWNRYQMELGQALDQLGDAAATGDQLLEAATLAADALEPDRSVEFAREAALRGTAHADSVRILLIKGWTWDVILSTTSRTTTELNQYLSVADTVVRIRPHYADAHLFRARVLALIPGRGSEALPAVRRAIDVSNQNGEDSQRFWSAYHTLAAAHGTVNDDDVAFKGLIDATGGNRWNWSSHAGHLQRQKRWKESADAYITAYVMSEAEDVDSLCKAIMPYWVEELNDDALSVARMCVEAYALAPAVDTAQVVFAHRAISSILTDRSVYSTAEVHARQALQLDPSDEWAALALTEALLGSERYTEAATAAEQAIRLSDGKYSTMHFALGSAYFGLSDWSRCERAFRRADELNPEDTSAAYNTALCLARQGYYRDAAQWMTKVLSRNPRHPRRADIEAMVAGWRR